MFKVRAASLQGNSSDGISYKRKVDAIEHAVALLKADKAPVIWVVDGAGTVVADLQSLKVLAGLPLALRKDSVH